MDRAVNVEIGLECPIFVIVIFSYCGSVLQFGAHSRYYEGALTQKRSFLVLCTTFRSDFHQKSNKHSSLNLSFDALSKWHEPNIRHIIFQNLYHVWKSMSFCKECHPFDQQSVNLKLFLLSRVELCLLRNFKCITALHTLPISFIYHNKFHCN